MKTAATWRCCLRPGPPPVYNGLLPVDRSDADGIGISALSVHESGTPPSKKIDTMAGGGGVAHRRKRREGPPLPPPHDGGGGRRKHRGPPKPPPKAPQ